MKLKKLKEECEEVVEPRDPDEFGFTFKDKSKEKFRSYYP